MARRRSVRGDVPPDLDRGRPGCVLHCRSPAPLTGASLWRITTDQPSNMTSFTDGVVDCIDKKYGQGKRSECTCTCGTAGGETGEHIVPLLSSLYTCRTLASFVCANVRVLCKRCWWWDRENRRVRIGEDPFRVVQCRTGQSQGNLWMRMGSRKGESKVRKGAWGTKGKREQ